MENDVLLILSFIDRLPTINTLPELVNELTAALQTLGFSRFIMTRLPASNERDAEPLILAHTWSKEWGDRYRSEAFFWHDPVTRFSFAHDRPFTWNEARQQSARTKMALQIESEAKGVGMWDGIGFPMGDRGSIQSVVSIAADRKIEMSESAKAMLSLLCTCAERRAVDILQPRIIAKNLSDREREVLSWIANGKTIQDTADILSISPVTAEKHAQNARAKLDATNTVQAVARALMNRLIKL